MDFVTRFEEADVLAFDQSIAKHLASAMIAQTLTYDEEDVEAPCMNIVAFASDSDDAEVLFSV